MIHTLRPVVRGWANYYKFVNSAETFHELDYYLCQKFLKWYRGKYRKPMRDGTREGLKWINGEEPLRLCRFGDVKVTRYKWRRIPNPYIEMNVKRMISSPFPEVKWYGKAKQNFNLRIQCFQRDDGVCQICLRPKTNLAAHHIIPLSENGEDTLGNLATLCKDCHKKYSWQEIKRLVGSRVR